jgi:hypothetical protein
MAAKWTRHLRRSDSNSIFVNGHSGGCIGQMALIKSSRQYIQKKDIVGGTMTILAMYQTPFSQLKNVTSE